MGGLKDKIMGVLTAALFPENFTCELCGREIYDGGHFCRGCLEQITFNYKCTCPKCGRRTEYDYLCLECKEEAPLYDRAASAMVYDGGGQQLVLRFKNGSPYLKDYFAELLAEHCSKFDGAEAIVFVPMTAKSIRRRGYNQSHLLAKELSKLIKLPVIDAVKKVKNTPQQKSLNKRERESNLSGCFKVDGEQVKGKKLILVDDVLTTGATANALSQLLKKHGAEAVYFLTVASVEYKRTL